MQRLPAEFLRLISDLANLAGFEGLLLSWKQLYALGKHRLEEYKCRNKNQNLVLHELYDPGDVLNLHRAVFGFIYRPDVAIFIRSLSVMSGEDYTIVASNPTGRP